MTLLPVKYIIGIRHQRLFKFIDHIGDIVDDLIPLQGTGSFPQRCFADVGRSPDNNSFRLKDEDDTFFVDCNFDGVVLTVDMESEPALKPKEIEDIFISIANKVLPHTKGDNINRIGIMNIFRFENIGNISSQVYDSFFKFKHSGTTDDLGFRLVFKNHVSDSMVKASTNDYKTSIIQLAVKRSEKDDAALPSILEFSIDHQIHFNPEKKFRKELVEAHNKDFDSYIKDVISNNISQITSKLKNVS